MKKRKEKAAAYGVIGLGRFGTAIAITLAEAGKDVIVIDCDEEKVRALRPYTDYAYVTGNLSKEALQEIGMQDCDTVIIGIGDKIDTSILTTLNVVSLGVPRVIAKARSQEQGLVLEKIGAEVIYPERDMARRVGRQLLSGSFLDFIFLDNNVEIQQVAAGRRLIGQSVRDSDVRRRYSLNIIAIEHGGETDIEFSPDYCFREGDIVTVIGRQENIRRFEREQDE